MDQLETLQREYDEAAQSQKRALLQSIDNEWSNEGKYWKQRSRVDQLRKGDRNTIFFHSIAMVRGQRNKIFTLRKFDGRWNDNEVELKNDIVGYYKELFQFHDGSSVEEVLANITLMVTHEQNAPLMAEVFTLKIQEVVFSIRPHKASGPNGYNGHLF